jgi:hypothetical protein
MSCRSTMNNAASIVAAIVTKAHSLGRLRLGCRGTVCESQVQAAFLPGGSIRYLICRCNLHYCEVQIRMLRNHGASAVLQGGVDPPPCQQAGSSRFRSGADLCQQAPTSPARTAAILKALPEGSTRKCPFLARAHFARAAFLTGSTYRHGPELHSGAQNRSYCKRRGQLSSDLAW